MKARIAEERKPESQTDASTEETRDGLIYKDQYVGVAFLFDQIDKLATTESSL